MMKKIIKACIPPGYYNLLVDIFKICTNEYSTRSYSQEGEDLILSLLFDVGSKGFYVDVGAHHPMRFSNTYLFYKKGWRGINLDAMPGSMKPFKILRSRDINLEIPIAIDKQKLTYYHFNDSALNGFSKEISERRHASKDYQIICEKQIETDTLECVLDKYLPIGQKIDFLSIDVEGLDFQVIKSNNWNKYAPTIVVVEVLGSTFDEIVRSEINCFLEDKGYSIVAKTINSVFFRKNDDDMGNG